MKYKTKSLAPIALFKFREKSILKYRIFKWQFAHTPMTWILNHYPIMAQVFYIGTLMVMVILTFQFPRIIFNLFFINANQYLLF